MAKKNTPADAGKARLLFIGSLLKKALAFVGGAISTNPIVPALENVKCYAFDGKVTLTGSDLRTTMWVTIEADCFNLGPDGDLFLLPYALTNSLVASIGNNPVSLVIDNKLDENPKIWGSIINTSKGGAYKLAGENPIDFPKLGGAKGGTKRETVIMTFEGEDRSAFVRGLTNVAFAVGTDELRQAMTGVNLLGDGHSVTFAATDGHRLKKYPQILSAEVTNINVILPKRFITMLSKMSADLDEELPLTITIDTAYILATIGDYNLQSRLIDDTYPNFNNAIPTDNSLEFFTNKEEFTDALNRVLLIANKTTRQVRMSLTPGNLTISAEDLDYSNEGSEAISIDYQGEPFEIGFHGKNLLECIRSIEGKKLRITLSQPNRAGLLFGENDEVITLIMPVMLNIYA